MRTYIVGSVVLAGFIVAAAAGSAATQDSSPQQLFEAGKYNEAIQAIPEDAGDDMKYLAGQAHLRLNQNGEARARVQEMGGGDEGNPWTFVGRSLAAQAEGNMGDAEKHARKAVEMEGGLPEAHFQLGQALYASSNWAGASTAFEQASKLAPNHAYAHYFAGQAFYRAKRLDRMAQHFEYFLKLAPQAPERPQVEAVMRTVRGR